MGSARPKIFIVEDESIVAFDIECRLKNNGYDVVGNANSHSELMERICVSKPDLVLMDIRIKGDIDGIECAKQIRSIFATPVVFLTAYSDKNTIERATKTGAFGYILKPFNEKSLVSNIEMALSSYGEEKKILRHRDSYSITLNQLNLGIFIFDKDGHITFCNLAGEALTGLDRNEILGKPIKTLLFDKTSEKAIDFEAVIREKVKLNLFDVTAKNYDLPNAVSFDLTISPIIQEGKAAGGMVVFQNFGTVIISNLAGKKKSESSSESDSSFLELFMCPWCKKWEDEDKNWNQIEEFITKNLSAELHHMSCPECSKQILRTIELIIRGDPIHRQN